MRQVHGERHKDSYGSPRMTKELRARGVECCENWVAKVMKHTEIRAKSARRWVRTTDSKHRLPAAENVLDRHLTASMPNAAWVTDITYIPRARVGDGFGPTRGDAGPDRAFGPGQPVLQ